jgi:hypothetical protein
LNPQQGVILLPFFLWMQIWSCQELGSSQFFSNQSGYGHLLSSVLGLFVFLCPFPLTCNTAAQQQ